MSHNDPFYWYYVFGCVYYLPNVYKSNLLLDLFYNSKRTIIKNEKYSVVWSLVSPIRRRA